MTTIAGRTVLGERVDQFAFEQVEGEHATAIPVLAPVSMDNRQSAAMTSGLKPSEGTAASTC